MVSPHRLTEILEDGRVTDPLWCGYGYGSRMGGKPGIGLRIQRPRARADVMARRGAADLRLRLFAGLAIRGVQSRRAPGPTPRYQAPVNGT